MDYEIFVKIARKTCQKLIDGKYTEIANEFGYALAFDIPHAAALKRDFALALGVDAALQGEDNFEMVIKKFADNTEGFDYLIECQLTLSGSDDYILVEIVLNKSGLYLEDISRMLAI